MNYEVFHTRRFIRKVKLYLPPTNQEFTRFLSLVGDSNELKDNEIIVYLKEHYNQIIVCFSDLLDMDIPVWVY